MDGINFQWATLILGSSNHHCYSLQKIHFSNWYAPLQKENNVCKMLVENMKWKSMFVSFNSSNKLPKIVSLQESSYNKVSKILYL